MQCNARSIVLPLMLLTWLTARAEASSPEERAEEIAFFESRVRPVLASQCAKCHGSRGTPAKSEPRLVEREALIAANGSKPALVTPGEPGKSPLIEMLRKAQDDENASAWHRLPPEQVVDFESWVRRGAAMPEEATPPPPSTLDLAAARKFWSLRPLGEAPVPAVNLPAWTQNPIDAFVLAKMQEKALAPVAPADKRTLLRRATFDLTGLPPTPQEIDAFLADTTPGAFAQVVDRLLASPAYGERWGRHWLDLARYSDTAGDDADYPIPQAALYRNWVIDAFNQHKPYNQFVQEQIAGDLMPARDDADRRSHIVATGYLALSRRFGVSPETEMQLTIADTIDTLGRSILGATLGCARCHDHKFDPFTMRDYYALYGIFDSSRYAFPGSEERPFQKDFVPLIERAQAEALLRPYEAKVAAAEAEVRRLFHERAMATERAVYNRLTSEWDQAKRHRT
ncbi:MAG TPA: DUF1549 domain-containing protein, partial [Bradyrhizobium sp.]